MITRNRGKEKHSFSRPFLIVLSYGVVVNRRNEFSTEDAKRTDVGPPAGVSVTLKPRLGLSNAGFLRPWQQPDCCSDGLKKQRIIIDFFLFLTVSRMWEIVYEQDAEERERYRMCIYIDYYKGENIYMHALLAKFY